MRFRLVTPERVLFDEEAASVTLPTSEGEITILPGHATLAALLKAGIVKLKHMESHETDVAVSAGFINIDKDVVTALADTAERGEELDLSVIEEAKRRAEELMKNTSRRDDVAFASAAAGLERELARYRVATTHRKRYAGTK